MITQIKIDPSDLAKIRNLCRGVEGLAEKVVQMSVNKTLPGVRSDASTLVRQEITAKKAAVDETFKIHLMTAANLSGADFDCTGKPLPLSAFTHSQTAKGVTVKINKNGSRILFRSAFLKTYKSGHKAVLNREWHDEAPLKKRDIAYGRLPEKYRMPIEELFGPGVPDILKRPAVMTELLSKAEARLHTELLRALNYELSKL